MKIFVLKLISALFVNAARALALWLLICLFILLFDTGVTIETLLPVYPFVYFIFLALAVAKFEKKYLS